MKITPREGDYVLTKGMTEDQYHAVAKVFMKAGFSAGEYPYIDSANRWPCLGIKEHGIYHGGKSFKGGRELSLSDLLGEENKLPWWELKELPPIGEKVVMASKEDRKSYTPRPGHAGREVIILAHVTAPNGQPCAVYCSENCNTDSISGIAAWFAFKPLKSDREVAIEEMKNIIYGIGDNLKAATAIYDLGYRKVEK